VRHRDGGLVLAAAGPAILARLYDCQRTEPLFCYRACEALGRLRDPVAVPPLLRLAGNARIPWYTRVMVIDALGAIGDSSARAVLEAAAQDGDGTVRERARRALTLLRGS
jgi:HEAT repeat protein